MRSCNFLRLIYNKLTSRSYGYFLKFSYFYFLRNWFFQLCQKLQSLVKKTQGILEVNTNQKLFQKFLNQNPILESLGPKWLKGPTKIQWEVVISNNCNMLNFLVFCAHLEFDKNYSIYNILFEILLPSFRNHSIDIQLFIPCWQFRCWLSN
jgi:hypothetical protein